jgi:hypothetical protein
MDLLSQAVVSVVGFIICFVLLLISLRRGWFPWGEWLGNEEVASLRQKIKQQDARLFEQSEQIRKLIEENLDWRRKTDKLEQRVADLEKEKGLRIGTKVLGIWPQRPQDPPLDLEGSRDAIYDAGFEFVPLFGEHANRQEILHHLRKGEVSIIEIGGHGTADGVPLADGLARAGWWEQVLKGRDHIRIVLFLTCFSDQSMFEAVRRAGVLHIITVNGEIQDKSAINFAQAFYSNYANGQTVAAAVRDAKLILDYTEAAKIELSKTVKEG